MLHELNDRIEVIALFAEGSVQPLRIRWRERVYKIQHIYSTWQYRQGSTREIHITAGTEAAQTMELVLTIDGAVLSWRLKRLGTSRY
ncbi:MAG: hypothetical protein H6695_10395 [Deferribacteres bacterium]|nr:hypothetical protein [candidate division KSB1 bacterium]MCB9510583.1 hypothetical protein [Deferribacteres bacterium]